MTNKSGDPARSSEGLYRQIGNLLQEPPDFSGFNDLTVEQMTWLGRARALVRQTGDVALSIAADQTAAAMVNGLVRVDVLPQVMMTLYSALAVAELSAPPGERGAFLPAGNRFDAFSAITKVLKTATSDLVIVDPYLDESILTDFGSAIPEGVSCRLLAGQRDAKSGLLPAAQAWVSQYGRARPLEVRLAAPGVLHDRAIFIDGTTAWISTQSFKDFARKSPAELMRSDDSAKLKIPAYDHIWATAKVVL